MQRHNYVEFKRGILMNFFFIICLLWYKLYIDFFIIIYLLSFYSLPTCKKCDCVRLVTMSQHSIIQRVSESMEAVFDIGSCHPGAMLREAWKEYKNQSVRGILMQIFFSSFLFSSACSFPFLLPPLFIHSFIYINHPTR